MSNLVYEPSSSSVTCNSSVPSKDSLHILNILRLSMWLDGHVYGVWMVRFSAFSFSTNTEVTQIYSALTLWFQEDWHLHILADTGHERRGFDKDRTDDGHMVHGSCQNAYKYWNDRRNFSQCLWVAVRQEANPWPREDCTADVIPVGQLDFPDSKWKLDVECYVSENIVFCQ